MNSLVEEFSVFEKNENLFERTYSGNAYWQSLRTEVYRTSVMKINKFQPTISKKIKRKICALCKAFFYAGNQIIRCRKIKKCDVILMDHRAGGNRFFDYWSLPKNIRWMKINDSLDTTNLSIKDKNNLILPYIKCLIRISWKKIFRCIQRDYDEFQFLEKLEKKLKKKYGVAKSAKQMEDLILYSIEVERVYKKYFEKVFEKSKCKAIVVVCYYSTVLYPAYKVAKERGVRIIELQHGNINYHDAYWFEDQRGVNNITPDYFLVWGKMHISETKLLPTTRAISIGFPYQEKMIQKLSSVKTEGKTIIIYPTESKEFEMVINEFVDKIVPMGYRVLMKIHPLQVKNFDFRYPILSQNRYLEIITDQTKGIYYWLKIGSFHIVAHTTVGLEAIAFANANICVAENVPHDQNKVLLDSGLARGFSTANELINLVLNPVETNMDTVRGSFWKEHPGENIKTFFARMKQQNWPSGLEYQEQDE